MSLSLEDLVKGRPELADRVSDEAAKVEAELRRQVQSDVRLVHEIGCHTLKSGGKRLRPAFVALSAMACDGEFDSERCVQLGACMELIHMATLIHDDVIDGAATRRGRPTAGAIFGNSATILAGDVLLARAMRMLTVDEDMNVVRAVSNAVVEMAEGEVREVEVRGEFELPVSDYIEIVRLKTASFIRCCCEIGCLAAGGDDARRRAMTEYGEHVGIAFQIADDVLDYRGDAERTGKPIGTDFREGCATLPLILLRGKMSIEEAEVARQRFGNGVSDDEMRMISGWMDSRGAFAEARELSETHAAKATNALEAMPPGDARDALRAVAEFVVSRPA